ncbi:hypothetical protein J3A83DRAFT_4356783 [Scleroderma citrinum]
MQPWSSAHQEWFECHMANITASCGFPFSWVDNQAVRDFLDDLLSNAAHLSSYQLTSCVAVKNASRRCEGTLQTDGWTGVNFHHFVAFVVTTVRCKAHTIKVVDVTADRQTAEHLKVLVKEIIQKVEKDWGVKIVAVTSDASAPDCYAHQPLSSLPGYEARLR